MPRLPKEYLEFSDKITEILRHKPKKGYVESVMESGQPEPLDPIEEVSSVMASGNKEAAIRILENALQDETKRELLAYLDDLDNFLTELIDELRALPNKDAIPDTEPETKSSMLPVIAIGLALLIGIIAVVFYVFRQ